MEQFPTVIEGEQQIADRYVTRDWFDRFLAYLDAKPKTVETYSRALKSFFSHLQAVGVTQPTREDILEYRSWLMESHKPSTVQTYIVAVRLFFRWTAWEGLYPDIADHVKGAKLDRQHKKDYLTAWQLYSVLANIDRRTIRGLRDYAIVSLMGVTGLRTVEVTRANIEDVREKENGKVLYIQGKGQDERAEFVRLPSEIEEAIYVYLEVRGETDGRAPLFVSTSNNNYGQRLTTRSISEIAKRCMRAAGFSSDRLTAHSLRHTAITLALLGGATLQETQQFARHGSITTTQIYAHNLEKVNNPCAGIVAASIFRQK